MQKESASVICHVFASSCMKGTFQGFSFVFGFLFVCFILFYVIKKSCNVSKKLDRKVHEHLSSEKMVRTCTS